MMYLKFCNTHSPSPIQERVICCTQYSVAHDDGFRVYYEQGMWEKVSPNDWLNMLVMNEHGKTIDKIEA